MALSRIPESSRRMDVTASRLQVKMSEFFPSLPHLLRDISPGPYGLYVKVWRRILRFERELLENNHWMGYLASIVPESPDHVIGSGT